MTASPDIADPATNPDPTTAPWIVLELAPDQVAQHPDNLRDPHRGIKELTASIAELGVLVPLIVVPVGAVPQNEFNPQVTHVAVDGSRRQAAARAAGMPVPCIVRPDLATARDTAITMAATGLARDGLTPREEAAAVQTMLDLGVTQTVIGRAIGRSRQHIATAKKAATLTTDIADTAGDYQFTLTDLATIAEFQHDEHAVAALVTAAPQAGSRMSSPVCVSSGANRTSAPPRSRSSPPPGSPSLTPNPPSTPAPGPGTSPRSATRTPPPVRA